MIHVIDIKNFRGFESARVERCARINVVVGENAAGKTAFLEALHLTGASGADIVLRLRQFRGFDGTVFGTPRDIERSLWSDLFYQFDTSKPVSISLDGEAGESRSLTIDKGDGSLLIPLTGETFAASDIRFRWKGPGDRDFEDTPLISGEGLKARNIPAATDTFFFAHSANYSAKETASRFSAISTSGDEGDVVDPFREIFPWVQDISVEVLGGAPHLFARLDGSRKKVPLNSLSSGVNKLLSIAIAIAANPKATIIVDEIENGIHYTALDKMWSMLNGLSRKFDAQIFASTHSQECLESLVRVEGHSLDDVSLIRARRRESGTTLSHFSGSTLSAGISQEVEIR